MKENAFDSIKNCIKNNKSFILEAWAGSWKTYTLIQTIQYLLKEKWFSFAEKWQKIACITYTNIAKKELIERLDYNELIEINTIHEFLWSIISKYQWNLKKELLIYNLEFDNEKQVDNLDEILGKVDITYWNYWRRLKKWEITHEDVIHLSLVLLRKYPRLQKILLSKFPYFFIDEYQDTFTDIVNILLEILTNNKNVFFLWFFWDFMQKIYQDNRVWRIENDNLEKIQKIENYRSWKKIVKLINKVRYINDDLKQESRKEYDWEVEFYYSNSGISEIDKYNTLKKKLWWSFSSNPKENKILVLTNKKIANDLWFENLLLIFTHRYGRFWNEILNQRDNAYIDFFLNKIEKIIYYYENKNYLEFFNLFWKEDFKINKLEDRKILKSLILWLKDIRNKETIWNVLNYIYDNKILEKTQRIILFENYLLKEFEEEEKIQRQEKNNKLKEDLMSLNYNEVINYNNYIENKTPYSTQHWTKWAEYDNVLLVIDDNHRWYKYRWFDKLVSWKILNKDDKKALENQERLLNLLYVSVSRAKKKLVTLYLSNLDTDWLNWWKNIFWEDNIHIL